MERIQLASKSLLVILIAGFSLFNPTRSLAHAPKYMLLAQSGFIQQNSTNKRIKFSPKAKVKLSRQFISKPTKLPTNNLVAEGWFDSQANAAKNQNFDFCVFGDSISKSLESTLGNKTFNFALGGMTTGSLVDQLNILAKANVKCQTAIIAMGTNDAQANVTNDTLIKNLKDSISLVRSMGANKIFLIPAFYSTVEASHDPKRAGTIARVEEVNAFIRQVAAAERAVLFEEDIQALYQGQSLRQDLTVDGVHLNCEGQNIYREALFKIIKGKTNVL